MMLRAQTQRDCKETRAPFCKFVVRALNTKYMYMLVCVCYDNAMQCCFVNLENGRTTGRVSRLVRPLVPIYMYNSMGLSSFQQDLSFLIKSS